LEFIVSFETALDLGLTVPPTAYSLATETIE
jgi:hypothetical protein